MDWDVTLINKAFGGKLLGGPEMKTTVCQVVALLPANIVEYVTSHVWFFSSTEDAWAYTFHGNDLQNKHFIFLSDELFSQDDSQIRFTIMHEIGHIILKHQNSIGRRQTESEIKKQETEADNFAKEYLD